MRLCSALPCSTLPPPGPCQGAPPCSRSYGAADREPCITSRVFEASRVSGAPGLGHSKGLLPDFLTSQCNPAGLSQPTALPTALPETRPFQELQLHGPAARDLPCQGLCRFLLQAALSTLPLPTASNPSLLSSPLPMGVRAPSPSALCRGAAPGQSCLSAPGPSCQELSLSQEPSPDQQQRHWNQPSGGFGDEPMNLRH